MKEQIPTQDTKKEVKIEVINEFNHPEEIIDEAKKIAMDLGECYFEFNDDGNPIMEAPKSVEIWEHHSGAGIGLKITRADGVETNSSISPRKIAQWEKDGILKRE